MVALLSLPPPPEDETDAPPQLTAEGPDDRFGARFGSCQPYEYWLVNGDEPPRLLLEICNDGHGASGVGEDLVSIPGDGTLRYQVNGGSAWRWDRDVAISLAPLQRMTERSSGYWTVGENNETASWDHTTFSGQTQWAAPKCDTKNGPSQEIVERAFTRIPSVAPVASFVDGGWKSSGLGACAATLREDGSARLAAVVMDGVVYVEAEDDVISGRDLLEIWTHPEAPSYSSHCVETDEAVTGLSISPESGKPKARGRTDLTPPVLLEGALDKERRVFRAAFRLPRPDAALTVVYRDNDQGRGYRRVLETSGLDTRDATTLGRVRIVPPSEATCVLVDGKLEAVGAPSDPGQAFIGF